jgi:parallel beta-helix repeat protein
MGDGIGLYYSPYNNYPGFTIEAGSIDSSSGSAIAAVSSTSVRTPSFIAITPNTTSFGMVGLGYAPQTTIPSKTYNAYFYDSTGKFIYSTQRIRTRDTVQIPKGATQMKLSWEGYINSSTGTVDLLGGSSVNTTPYWVLLITSGLADGVHVEFNQIHRCHRGGLFLGTNNAVIRKNYFHDTGMDGSTDIDGLPTFPYSTRYCIDTEDNVGQNCSIIDNVFANSRMAICLRGNYNEVSGNEFRHNTYGIELYKLDNVTIDRNYFYDSSLQCYAYDGYDRNWMITSNIFDGSSVNFAGKAGTLAVFNNNGFRNSSTFTSSVRILSYKHNVFNSSTHNISDKNTIIDNCMFINGSYIQATSVTWSIDNIIRCNFINSYVSMNATKNVTVRDSNFVNSGFLYNVNCSSFTAINCTFNNTSQPVVRSYTSLPNSIGLVTTYSLDLENCTLNLGVVPNAFVGSRSYNVGDIVTPTVYNGYYYVCTTTGIAGSTEPTWSTTVGATVQSGAAVFTVYQISSIPVIYGYGWGGLILNNCTLTLYNYTTYNNALLGYYGNLNGTLQITNTSITSVGSSATNSASSVSALKIDSKSAFTNFTNTNISVEVQSDMMTNAPTVGTFTLGQTIANKNPQSGQYLGWVCTTAGTASNVTWASGTSYTVNKVVNVGGNVYQCTVAGGSTSTSQPTGTSTVATSYPDGYSWVYVNPLAVFKTYGIIS